MRVGRWREVVVLTLAASLAGCERAVNQGGPTGPGPEIPGPQVPGILEVTVTVEGTRPDADGYTVTLVGADRPAAPVDPAGGTVRFSDLQPGSHTVRLDDLAPHCFTADTNPRRVDLRPDQTFTLHFLVRCQGPGRLRIVTKSAGVDPDPNGYLLILESSSLRGEPIGANDSLLVSADEFEEATLNVRLSEVADHCLVESMVTPGQAVASFDPLRVRLLDEVTVRVQFEITCLQSGSMLAYQDDASFPIDIYILPAIGGHPLNLTNHPATDMNPSLSPDRSRVVFASNRGGPDEFSFDLYAVNSDGTGLIRLTKTPGFELAGPQAWSPDGSRIAFAYSDSSGTDVYVMNADGSGVVRLTEEGSIHCAPAWSPDGEWIAFCWQGGIYRMSLSPESSLLQIVREGFDPAWSPDGSRIAYSAGFAWDWPLADLAVVGVDGSGFVQLHPDLNNNDLALSPNWSPDGSWIAFARTRFAGFEVVIVPFHGDHFGEVIRLTTGLSPSWR